MATPTNTVPSPAPANHSGSGSLNSRRSSAEWTQVVRGGESLAVTPATSSSEVTSASGSLSPDAASTEAQVESSRSGDGCGGRGGSHSNAAKKPAWKKPVKGAVTSAAPADDVVVIISPVMGDAVSWPALSDSTNKASPKSDSVKAFSVSEGTGMSSSSHWQASTNNANPKSTRGPTRQRPMKRSGGNSNHNALANGGFSQKQGQGSEVEIAHNNSGKSDNSVAESSSRDNSHRDGQRGGFGSQSHVGNEHQHQRNSNRRGNVGPHPRGDGMYHHGGYGGKRDQEHGNHDWNPHRGWGNRDARVQPQRGPARPFMQGPPQTSPPFIPPPMPVQPYRTPMVYPDVPPLFYVPGPHLDPLRMPMLASMPPVLFHIPDSQLHTKIVNQIDYYFSNENLIKDTFLRQNMDEHGWVPVTLIAGFKKVMQLTDNIQLILDAVRSSTVVEVQGEKLRRRNDWHRWIMPPSVQNSTMLSPQSLQKSGLDLLAENIQSVAFDDKPVRYGNSEAYLSRSSSAELSSPAEQFGNEMAGQAGAPHAQPMPVGNPS